ncbi:hypothetical protein GYMLUDRAFT_262624 [Collybiopsis luxurians FD-317 M1]|uniref:Unplaced genomic scaffold GYMLUscaffold_38, whole genome shotgun sequence n=1 Tax=Collybiopsis luxurians FD-317 M1 TaxID=944289 RepID=A0A0D0C745_9AGAR|nr:hypothetical protein GYMLUDRAFT_262624 [Collybiopsis luxurians FD-317 M1]
MSHTQKALFFTSAHSYEISSRPIPKPSPGHILVKVKSISLNPIDWKVQDLPGFDGLIKQYPVVLGQDAAGDVVGIGEGVLGYSKNDRVFFQCAGYLGDDHGAFQEYILVPAEIASKIPSNLSYDQAASIPLALTTATVSLFAPVPNGSGLNPTFDPHVRYSGQSAFVAGGGTSVGQFAIQLLKTLDFKHIITNSAAEHFDYLRSLGATDLIDRNEVSDKDLSKIIESIAGGKVDAAIDAAGTPTTQAAALACLKSGTHLGTVLPLKTEVPKGNTAGMIWGSTWSDFNREFGKAQWAKLESLFGTEILKPCRIVELSGGLEGILAGLRDLKADKYRGRKVVISF